MKRYAVAVIGILLSFGVVATPASAQLFVGGADNDAFFNNFENLFDSTGEWLDPATIPVVGNYLAGIINVQNIDANGMTHYFSGPTEQLTGVFAQKIIETKLDGFGITHFTLGNPTLTSFCKGGLGGDCFSTGLAAGEMFAFYQQTGGGTTVFESNGTMLDDVTKATDGTKLLTFGLDATDGAGPDTIFGTFDDTGYTYSHPILGANPTGHAFGALDVKFNGLAPTITFTSINDTNECEVGGTPAEGILCFASDPVPLLNGLVFTSEFERNSLGIANPNSTPGTSPWEFRSNDPATLHPEIIPEVSSLWLLGMGLSSFGVFRRKKFLV